MDQLGHHEVGRSRHEGTKAGRRNGDDLIIYLKPLNISSQCHNSPCAFPAERYRSIREVGGYTQSLHHFSEAKANGMDPNLNLTRAWSSARGGLERQLVQNTRRGYFQAER